MGVVGTSAGGGRVTAENLEPQNIRKGVKIVVKKGSQVVESVMGTLQTLTATVLFVAARGTGSSNWCTIAEYPTPGYMEWVDGSSRIWDRYRFLKAGTYRVYWYDHRDPVAHGWTPQAGSSNHVETLSFGSDHYATVRANPGDWFQVAPNVHRLTCWVQYVGE